MATTSGDLPLGAHLSRLDLDDGPTHPILKLPPEILSEIFIECLPEYSAAPHPSRAPLALAAISRDWRQVALSTPWLWNCFILSVDLSKPTGNAVRLFEMWLTRGGSSPLTILISCSDASLPGRGVLPEQLVKALSQSSSRWYDINLVLPLPEFYRLRADNGLPLLQRLAIKDSAAVYELSSSAEPSSRPPLDLFTAAPALCDVLLGAGITLSDVVLPLAQLTHFDSTLTADCLRVFSEAPRLAEIRLDPHILVNEHSRPLLPVKSQVKSLLCETTAGWDDSGFLKGLIYITCPALEILSISGHVVSPLSSQPLLRFLARSSPPLRKLSVDLAPLFARTAQCLLADIAQCLLAVPTLVELELGSMAHETAQDIFTRMVDGMPASSNPFLPRLEVLKVRVDLPPQNSQWTFGPMVDMLVARRNVLVESHDDEDLHKPTATRLQTFCFGFKSEFLSPFAIPPEIPKLDPLLLEQLEILAGEGMHIDLVMNNLREDVRVQY